jgi:hypothetical protein
MENTANIQTAILQVDKSCVYAHRNGQAFRVVRIVKDMGYILDINGVEMEFCFEEAILQN